MIYFCKFLFAYAQKRLIRIWLLNSESFFCSEHIPAPWSNLHAKCNEHTPADRAAYMSTTPITFQPQQQLHFPHINQGETTSYSPFFHWLVFPTAWRWAMRTKSIPQVSWKHSLINFTPISIFNNCFWQWDFAMFSRQLGAQLSQHCLGDSAQKLLLPFGVNERGIIQLVSVAHFLPHFSQALPIYYSRLLARCPGLLVSSASWLQVRFPALWSWPLVVWLHGTVQEACGEHN